MRDMIAVAAALPQNASCTDWIGGEANFQINERYLEDSKAMAPSSLRRRGLRLRPSVTGVKLDMLLGNANIKFDPNRESEVVIQAGTLVPDRVHVAGKRKCQV